MPSLQTDFMNQTIRIQPIASEQDAAMANIIRTSLKAHHLNIPGTAYFDENVDHLSSFYSKPGRAYYVLLRGDTVIGGVGFAEFDGFPDCCELQKLYLLASETGQGLGYRMIKYVETQARLLGYRSIYLETHETLSAAIHEYERMGYSEIARPKSVVHTTMNKFYRKDLTNK